MKPIIAITTCYDSQNMIGRHFHAYGLNYYYLKELYPKAILSAGGIPIMLPFHPNTEILEKVDGLLLSGGDIFGLTGLDMLFTPPDNEEHKRSFFERGLIDKAVKIDLPILGICFGEQLLNIYYGGTLCRSIKTFKDKKTAYRHLYKKHKVLIRAGTFLKDIVKKKEITVYSSHEQAIDHLGKGLAVSAVSDDGLIEAIELPGRRFLIGLGWHPEMEPTTPQVFRKSIEVCSDR